MTSIIDVIAASVEHIGREIQGLAQVEMYNGPLTDPLSTRKAIRTPACFITCVGGKPDADPGTSQVDFDARFMALLVTRSQSASENPAHSVIALAEAVMLRVRLTRWGLDDVGVAVILASRNEFNAKLDALGLQVWRVEWNQKVRLGDSVWDGAGIIPCEVYLGFAPKVGPEHIGDYTKIAHDEEQCPEL